MNDQLYGLLSNTAIQKNEYDGNFRSCYGPPSNWMVDNSKLSDFLACYCDIVSKHGEEGGFSLAERPGKESPVIADMIFRFHYDNFLFERLKTTRPYKPVLIAELCTIYADILRETIESADGGVLCAFVMESDAWIDANKYINWQLRIQFPYTRVSRSVLTSIRSQAVVNIGKRNLMQYFTNTPADNWDKILLPIGEFVTMYGSTSSPEAKPLNTLTVLTSDNYERDQDEYYNAEDPDASEISSEAYNRAYEDRIFELFSEDNDELIDISGAVDVINNGYAQYFDFVFDVTNHDHEYYIPVFLSVNYYLTMSKLVTKKVDSGNTNFEYRAQDADEDDISLCLRFLRMIGNSRYSHENEWLDIGRALYNSTDGAEIGLLTWINFTNKALETIDQPEFMTNSDYPTIQESCRIIYGSINKNNISVKTLAWYARQDNPDAYNHWHAEWIKFAMMKAVSTTHNEVSIAFYRTYWLTYTFCSTTNVWYEYRSPRWTKVNNGFKIRKTISNDFCKRFERMRTVLSSTGESMNNEDARTKNEATIKAINALIYKLKDNRYKGNILAECKEMFENDKMSKLLDSNGDIFCASNIILECVGPTIYYREGKPEDFISMTCGIKYNSSYHWEHPHVKKLMYWMRQAFPNDALRHHFLKFSASCIKSGNMDKIFPIFSGSGNNSKSMVVKLFEVTFGEYAVKIPVGILTDKGGNSSGPTPHTARLNHVKLAFMDEPDDTVNFNKGVVKKHTGGDRFFSRACNENGGDIELTYKLIMQCNAIAGFDNPDAPTKARMRIMPFLSKWKKEGVPETEEEQFAQGIFLEDHNFDKQIPLMAPAFLWVITQYWPYYKAEGLKDPEVVVEVTNKYWAETDVYGQFILDNIEVILTEDKKPNPAFKIKATDLLKDFRDWYRDTHPGKTVPESRFVKLEFSNRWGEMIENHWHGIRLVGSDVDYSDKFNSGKLKGFQ